MTTLPIQVQTRHIKYGECQNAKKCMIAQAINDEYQLDYVAVRANGITITKRNDDGSRVRQHWALPLKAARALVRFDAGEEISPFKFNATLIDEKTFLLAPEEAREAQRLRAINNRSVAKATGKKYQHFRPRTGGV